MLQAMSAPARARVSVSSRAVQALLLVLLWLGLPLSPWVCSLLSGRWQFLRHYGDTVRRSARMLRALHRADVIARNVSRAWWDAGALKPVERIEGQCTHCGNCCVQHTCVFLQMDSTGHSGCQIYGNWFFKRLTCGQYPLDAQDIAVYSCPSFRVHRGHGAAAGKVIPIVVQSPHEISSR